MSIKQLIEKIKEKIKDVFNFRKGYIEYDSKKRDWIFPL